ncbi:UGSC family (seleno)protein [Pseudonocardia autotrophica]|uniref:UGSC family (seleno)protein n=1 Tax=Pseudonocardia autotrophica TaxID=2074 RepID=UPI00105C77E0|nr:hypothetical protein [Pseudonocardia autotrophica]
MSGDAAFEMRVLNPTADRYGTDLADLAPRPRSLSSLTVGLLWNGKPNGDVALRAIGSAIEERLHGTRTLFYSGSIPCDRELLDQVIAECDVVVACTADCGSCSSWITHDASVLERAGIPAVVVASKGFEEDIAASARAFGVPNVQTVVVPEVYNNITAEASTRQSLDALDRIIATLEGAADAAEPPAGLDDPAELAVHRSGPGRAARRLQRPLPGPRLGRRLPAAAADPGGGRRAGPADRRRPGRGAVHGAARQRQATPRQDRHRLRDGRHHGRRDGRRRGRAAGDAGPGPAGPVPHHADVDQRARPAGPGERAARPRVGINGGRGCIGPGARNRVNLRIGRAIVLR